MSQAGLSNINSAVVGGAEQFGLPDSSIITPTGSPLEVDFQNGNGISITQGTNTHDIKISLASPNQVISDFDDLISFRSEGGKFEWTSNGFSKFDIINGTSTNPGIIQITHSIAPNTGAFSPCSDSQSVGSFALGGGSLNVNFVFDLGALSDGVNTYTIFLGLLDAITINAIPPTPPTDGCFFKYTNSVNAGKWQIVTEAASVATTANTNTLAATGFHNYGIQVNAAGTSVAFTIDGVTVANSPLTTNIPTAALMPAVFVNITAGTPANMKFDLFYYTQNLTVAR